LESYNQKKYTQALGIIQQVLKVDPNNATAYYYKGMVLNEQKQVEGAIQSYREAIRKNPDFGDAYYALGLLLDTKKDKLGAKNAFQKFIELSKGNDDDFTKYAQQRVQSL
jgi:tetratricopeptide (TPR) repeat protein